MKNINLILAVIVTLVLYMYTPCVHAGAYSWTDKDGVRHSSDLPPSEYMKQKQKEKASLQGVDELPPEVTQTLLDKKGKNTAPEIDANKAPIAPDAINKQTVKTQPKYEMPLNKEKSMAPPKPQAVETQKKYVIPSPAQTVKPTPVLPEPLTKERISFYKNQLAKLKELIKSQEELIAEDVRTIGLIENRINQIKSIQGPKSDRLKNEFQQSEKSLVAAKNRLKTDVRELQVLQSNVNNYQLKLKSAQ